MSQTILTLACSAPKGIPQAPKAKKAKPVPKRIRPIANFIGPLGLNLEVHIFENNGANNIMNREFKTENQEAGISVAVTENSRTIIQTTIPQMMAKLTPKKKLDNMKLLSILLNKP